MYLTDVIYVNTLLIMRGSWQATLPLTSIQSVCAQSSAIPASAASAAAMAAIALALNALSR